MSTFQKGYVVAAVLAVLTIVEYIFAIQIDHDIVRFAGLAIAGIAKAALIAVYFMHIARAWQRNEAH
jgi:caa(3)-type oxidase subunit IV